MLNEMHMILTQYGAGAYGIFIMGFIVGILVYWLVKNRKAIFGGNQKSKNKGT